MERKKLLKVVFWGSFISGIWLCIGGVFIMPLLGPGCVLLAASLAMYQSAYNSNVPRGTKEDDAPTIETINVDRERRRSDISSTYVIQNNMFFVYKDLHRNVRRHDVPLRPETPALDTPRQTLILE